MTEQTEPKYKVGQWVIVNGNKRPLQICNIMKEYGIGRILYSFEDYDSVYGETEILYPVKIYPDYGDVFCKECKHFPIKDMNDDIWSVYWSEYECPLVKWALKAISPSGTRLNNARTQTGNNMYDIEFLQPPPNCHCFEPKDKE